MSAIGLEDHLAARFFSKVYCWLPSHLTVRGLAQDLITAEYDQRKAAGALTGDDLSASLVAIGFQRAVVDSFIARIKDREIVHHQGLRNVAFDLIDSGIHHWAANYYTHSDEPEDGETKRKGSADCGGRDLGNGGRGQGGGRGSGRGKKEEENQCQGGGEEEEEEEEEEEVITLFHGTTFEAAKSAFRRVDLRRGRENTDFAIERAFYLGNNASLAQRWADQKAASRGWDPVPAYLVFTVNTRMLAKHRRKEFGRADDEWKKKWEDCEEMSDARYPFRQYAALTPRAVDFLNRSPCKLCKWDTGKWVVVAQRPA
ncbi:uncharacterized protein ACA1_231120 [Acanthamoeba castellanii str. Neff]|uniref:Uncharacterized protein n=1 Tax=Acanthamoeba castellanii (strain ATCC 30010 / Neff) TaxID=1257118 RepID=L8H931_ACACF|nr:uncharacterized protein ACA1_231120 [Acanthamoeba castellanii str. Neff]ELR21675.1 hypothetical protein ACA1_231120 [Acanthamoeba castellanii str. Neff]